MENDANGAFLLEILDEQEDLEVDIDRIRMVCEHIVEEENIKTGKVNVVLVNNDTIQQFNRDFLQHNYPTDVISFPSEYRSSEGYLEGEILVSTETAKERAKEFSWSAEEELLLYIIHGTLHLVGYDDTQPDKQAEMQEKERHYMGMLGIQVPHWNWDDWDLDESDLS